MRVDEERVLTGAPVNGPHPSTKSAGRAERREQVGQRESSSFPSPPSLCLSSWVYPRGKWISPMLTCHTPQTGYLQLIFTVHHSLCVVQPLSCVQLFVIPWVAAFQASLSFTIFWNLLKLVHWVSDAIQPSVLCCPLLLPPSIFPSVRVFSNESVLCIRWPSWASASAWVLPMNIQEWFSLGLTGVIFLLSKGRSRVFSSTAVQKLQFFGAQPSLWSNSHIHTCLQQKSYLWLYGPLSLYFDLLLMSISFLSKIVKSSYSILFVSLEKGLAYSVSTAIFSGPSNYQVLN